MEFSPLLEWLCSFWTIDDDLFAVVCFFVAEINCYLIII